MLSPTIHGVIESQKAISGIPVEPVSPNIRIRHVGYGTHPLGPVWKPRRGNGVGAESERRSRASDQGFGRKPIEITTDLPPIRTFGGCHSIHLSYGRDERATGASHATHATELELTMPPA